MFKYILQYFASFIFTSLIDIIWHIVIFGKIYSQELQKVSLLNNGQIALKPIPGILSQILVVLAINVLVLYKNQNLELIDGAIIGACAGVLAISVYGLVNYALIKNWELNITILEIIWGPIIGSLSGIFIVWFKNQILKF